MRHRRFQGLAACLLLMATHVRGQEATPEFDPLGKLVEGPRLVRVMVEYIEVPHETLTRLLLEPRKGSHDKELRATVGKLVGEGKATVVETMLCTGRSGEKTTAESIEEFIYPTEYEPGEIPNEIHTTESGDKVKSDGRDHAIGPTPTSFEVRNLGSTLEIEPTIGAGNQLIDLRMAPDIVYHVGNETWTEWKDAHGDASIRMPTMYRLGLTTAVTVVDGQVLLAAALSPKGENGFPDFKRKLMVFVRCDILTVGQ
ncbi:hypothetical protein [Luteolibacter marinus]|uniref:hypothetical protein n=1 Tax=Luteolibacter marinus TaxID=2776705 RepID=UPI00186911C1|nr:hypothetical protein [Luteolibacter marinus]